MGELSVSGLVALSVPVMHALWPSLTVHVLYNDDD